MSTREVDAGMDESVTVAPHAGAPSTDRLHGSLSRTTKMRSWGSMAPSQGWVRRRSSLTRLSPSALLRGNVILAAFVVPESCSVHDSIVGSTRSKLVSELTRCTTTGVQPCATTNPMPTLYENPSARAHTMGSSSDAITLTR